MPKARTPRNTDDEGLALIARLLAPYLREEFQIAEEAPSADDWIDVAEEIPSRKRQAYAACRSGKLPGRKVARRWLVRRHDLDNWIESFSTATETPDPNVSSLDEMRARLGLKRVG